MNTPNTGEVMSDNNTTPAAKRKSPVIWIGCAVVAVIAIAVTMFAVATSHHIPSGYDDASTEAQSYADGYCGLTAAPGRAFDKCLDRMAINHDKELAGR
jgi:hypothetical protein